MSSSNPLAASPLTTLLVNPPTRLLPSAGFRVGPHILLFGRQPNCIGVFGNMAWSSWVNVGVLDRSRHLAPSFEPFMVSFDDGADDCGGGSSFSTCMYLAEYAVGTMVGMGKPFRLLTAGFFCCVARALAAAMMPSGLVRRRLGGCGGSSGEESRGCSSRENGLLTWFVCTL